MTDSVDQCVFYRKDDHAVRISTDAYVSHYKHSGPLKSTFSMTMDNAKKLRDDLSKVIEDHDGATQ